MRYLFEMLEFHRHVVVTQGKYTESIGFDDARELVLQFVCKLSN